MARRVLQVLVLVLTFHSRWWPTGAVTGLFGFGFTADRDMTPPHALPPILCVVGEDVSPTAS
ncbi:hypothetical protein J6590_056990 [Homalodisca vitripennis]|nr:hypothetical protein J6590_056990 [Homalodisca vitripennis]